MNWTNYYINTSLDLNYTNSSDYDVNSSIQGYITFRQPTDDTKEHELVDYFKIVVIYLLSVIATGVLGNLTLICVITGNRKLHRPPFYYILYTALTDLCKSVFCLPFLLSVVAHDFVWEYGPNLCDATGFASLLFSLSSISGQFSAVIDRYLSMKAPSFYSMCSNAAVSVTIIFFCTGVAFCLSFPPILGNNALVFKETEIQCTFNRDHINIDIIRGYTITFMLILIIILYLHCRVFSFLRNHRKMVPLEHRPARSDNWTFFGPGANRQGLINVLNGFTGGPPAAFANASQAFSHVGRIVHLRVTRCQHIPRTLFIANVFIFVLWMPYLFQVLVTSYIDNVFPVDFIAIATLLSHSHVSVSALVWLLTGSPVRKTIVNNLRKIRHQLSTGVSDTPVEQPESTRTMEVEV